MRASASSSVSAHTTDTARIGCGASLRADGTNSLRYARKRRNRGLGVDVVREREAEPE